MLFGFVRSRDIARKIVEDIDRVRKTYEFLKRNKPHAADLYLDDLAFALARSLTVDAETRKRNRFAQLFRPDPVQVFKEGMPLLIEQIERDNKQLADFLRLLLKRSKRYIQEPT